MTSGDASQALQNAYEHFRAGRLDSAAAGCDAVLLDAVDHAPALHLRGIVRLSQRRFEEAAADLKRSCAIDDSNPAVWNNWAAVSLRLKRPTDAAIACRRALSLRPEYFDAQVNLATALLRSDEPAEALAVLDKLLASTPSAAELHNNRGTALLKLGRFDEAIGAFRRAVELLPHDARTHSNLGNALRDTGQLDAAIAAYQHALGLDSNDATAHMNLGMALLQRGDIAWAWEEYEWRVRADEELAVLANDPRPRWNGDALGGRTILLRAEQGLGDVIQFARFVPRVAARGGNVIVECRPELHRLVRSVEGVRDVISPGAAVDADVQCPLLSLPHVLRLTSWEEIRRDAAYVHGDALRRREWMRDDGSLKVGIAWSGTATNRYRAIAFEQLTPLFAVSGVSFYSLQKGNAAAEIARQPFASRMIDFTSELHDLADTAGLIEALDLVITIDTAVAHLAGALAKPCWTMLYVTPDWRWLLDRADSPWYPSMRLFRQRTLGNWEPVVRDVAQALHDAAARRRTRVP